MQQQEMVVTTEEQARALQDAGFLGQFLEAASPSDVARRLGMPANLAHHHAKRHAALGLLREVARRDGKVFYRLAARSFKHAPSLLPPGDPGDGTEATLSRLTQAFLAAHERSDRRSAGEGGEGLVHYAFDPDARVPPPVSGCQVDRPSHLQVRTVRLDAARYREVVRRVQALLDELEAEEGGSASPCTLAFLALDGALHEGVEESTHLSTFPSPRPASGS